MLRLMVRLVSLLKYTQAWLPAIVIVTMLVFAILQAQQLRDISRRLTTLEAQTAAEAKTQAEMHDLLSNRLNTLDEEVFGTLTLALQRQEQLNKQPVRPGQLSAAALWLRTRDAQLTKRLEALEAWRLKLERN